MIDRGRIYNHRYGAKNKALQVQTVRAQSEDGKAKDVGWADAFGSWALVAVPLAPEADADGNVSAACEVLSYQYGDTTLAFATRDVRTFRYFQDLRPGESALGNAYGSRLKFGKTSVALNAFGGFLNFDQASKSVSLVGIPASEGQAAPYLSLSSTGIGMVSKTGQASIQVEGSGVSISGATLTIDTGTVSLGKGAAEPIVTYSMLQQLIMLLQAWATAVNGATGVPPPIFVIPPGKAIRVPYGG
jgi:hypothetical protein